jgi:putative FmdB family regulatory protein
VTFIIRERGDSTALIVAEYSCPECGEFEATVKRPTPDELDCPTCGATATWVISAPIGRVKRGEVTQGKYEPPPAGYMDTRAIGEGQPLEEFRADRRKLRAEERKREIKGTFE